MILISKTTTGLLIQKDDQDIEIDQNAIGCALGPILIALCESGRAIGEARRQAYESGLAQGRIQAMIEHETRQRIAARAIEDETPAAPLGPLAKAA